MQRLQHRLGMKLGDAEEGAGGAFRAAVALFPVLERAGTDADEGGELGLAEAEFLAHSLAFRKSGPRELTSLWKSSLGSKMRTAPFCGWDSSLPHRLRPSSTKRQLFRQSGRLVQQPLAGGFEVMSVQLDAGEVFDLLAVGGDGGGADA